MLLEGIRKTFYIHLPKFILFFEYKYLILEKKLTNSVFLRGIYVGCRRINNFTRNYSFDNTRKTQLKIKLNLYLVYQIIFPLF